MVMHSKIAVVTGAARGMGLAIAAQLARDGLEVYGLDVLKEELLQACTGLERQNLRFHPLPLDLADELAIRSLPVRLGADFADVCVLVNNAGISPKIDGKAPGVLGITLESWNTVMRINLTAALLIMQTCLPPMLRRGWGRIVNISSVGGKTTTGLAAASYTASKSGLLGLTRSVALEVSAQGITVNAVCPGRIETPMTGQAVPETNAEQLKRIPVGRFGTPQEVADLVSFLASERSGYITGAALDINGGLLMA